MCGKHLVFCRQTSLLSMRDAIEATWRAIISSFSSDDHKLEGCSVPMFFHRTGGRVDSFYESHLSR